MGAPDKENDPVTEQARVIAEAALKLTPTERAELVERILASITPGNLAAEQAQSAEAAERVAAYRRGEIDACDLDEALARYKER